MAAPNLRKTPTVLLTGFSPFGGERVNPSWQVASALHGKRIVGHRTVARELPVAFGASLKALRAAIRETRPSLVLCLGQAGGRARISLERVAINVDDARLPDNAGARPIDLPVIVGAPAAYFSTLPIKAMLSELQRAGIPAEVSQTAGTFVCNHVFYGLMHALRARRSLRAGFVHIPFSDTQALQHPGQPGMPLDTMTQALRIALRAALTHTEDDVALAAGAEH